MSTAQRLTIPLVRKTGNQILAGARRLAPRGSHLSGSGERRPGRNLQHTLRANLGVTPRFVTSMVGSENDYAATVHQGSRPHTIRSSQGRMLRFEWPRGTVLVRGRGGHRGRQLVFYFHSIRHPGNKRPVRYLTTPMHLFGRLNGFRTRSVPVGRSRLP